MKANSTQFSFGFESRKIATERLALPHFPEKWQSVGSGKWRYESFQERAKEPVAIFDFDSLGELSMDKYDTNNMTTVSTVRADLKTHLTIGRAAN